MTVDNPILPGFHPDPSVCRVGEDFYLVTSSFTYFPGIPVYHSRDLAHWDLVGHVLDRPTQLPQGEDEVSRGIFAATIRHHRGVFYVITTNVDHGGNFLVTATNPAGPWSDPIWLPGAPGIDPSLYFEGERVWYCGTRPRPEGPRFFGDWEVWVQELDPKTWTFVGQSWSIWNGALKGAIWPEGPHLYHHDGWY
ncbi:MAG TPA: family 43 glycosylhydrolase, partial [Spirochaetia bacterium]|nr:family 43 glycosylhydrolase [Spirochaetia bacterium]